MARRDPLGNFRFRLEIDGIQHAGFSEVVIGASATDVIDYREGNEPAHARKLPGLTKYGNVIMKRGLTDSMELYNWRKTDHRRPDQQWRPLRCNHPDRRSGK